MMFYLLINQPFRQKNCESLGRFVIFPIRRHALGHFGVLGHGLLVAVHIDVRHGIVCPRRHGGEHTQEQRRGCPHK